MDESTLELLREYSDQRILNTIKFSQTFSPEQVEAAKVIALERKLLDAEGIESLAKAAQLEKIATQKIKEGASPKMVEAYLSEQGLPPTLVEMVLKNAKTNAKTAKGGGNNSPIAAGLALFVVIFLIRMIIRVMRDSNY